jgi:hypothetical protein
MGGGLMQLVAYGAQDIYLTGNPQITFFKVVYRRHTNFSMESIQQTWNGNQLAGNSRISCTISRNGDLVCGLHIYAGMSTTVAGAYNPGALLVKEIDVEIGGQLIDRQSGNWMEVWTQLTKPNPTGSVLHVSGLSGADDGTLSGTNGTIQGTFNQLITKMGGVGNTTANPPVGTITAHIPLYFWFCRNPGLALPLIALQYHEVKINMTTGPTASDGGIDISKNELWADYIYLDTDERRRFAQVSHEYLIEQIQTDTIKGTN